MANNQASADRMIKALRKFGLAYPGAHLKSPWPSHKDLAVKDKTFCYLGLEGEPLSISCKLPHTSEAALLLPFTKPTAYGLGKSGWVSASFPEHDLPPMDLLEQWIDESYRAQAPKRLAAQLDGAATAPPKKAAAKKKAASKKKPPARKKAANKK